MSSQFDIESILDETFPQQPFFLEIGCWDGVQGSNSYHLEHERGWNGLCVDPFPKNFENRDCALCTKAISLDGLPREFIKVSTDRRNNGDVSYFSGFRDSISLHKDTIEQFCEYEVVKVETITIPQLYERYRLPHYIEFLSVDVEGAEMEVFSGINLEDYKFGMIIFEHNLDTIIGNSIGSLLEGQGYFHLKDTPVDSIFVAEWTYNGNFL